MNEIKKQLYKENVSAYLEKIRKDIIYYKAQLSDKIVYFGVDFKDVGDAEFLIEMPAKLLIRWIDNYENK